MSNDPGKKRGLFRRIFLLYGLILALAVVTVELYITNAVKENTIAGLVQNLAIQARLISGPLSFAVPSPLDETCRKFKETTNARVTVISLEGKVLGDSDTDSRLMENHAHRQEVQQAALYGTGTTIRFSDTLKYDFLYVAERITRGNQSAGYVRLSVPLASVDRAVNLIRLKIIAMVVAALLAAGAFSLWQLDRLRRLTVQIRDFSRDLARGEFGRKLHLEGASEFDEIAESLNEMSGDLKRSIAAGEEERHRLNVILQSIPDSLFILDAGGAIVLSSLASRKTFGEAALAGRPFIEVVRNTEFLSLMDEVRHVRQARVTELRIDSPFENHYVVHLSPLSYNEGELSGFVAVFHDITQLKKLEQARKDFVANISHEIKTPITAIMGFAETLLEGALDDRPHAEKFLETIRLNSERINSLVDDLMTISKIELGVIKVEKAPLVARQVLQQVVDTLGKKASMKNLALSLDLQAGPVEIEADRERLLQIVTNLVDNAIKFTEQGGVTIGMSTEGGRPLLYVQDTGIGIARKHLPRIGERFYRVDPGRSRNMGGTGLGLAIAKHLVKAHGWNMEIDSTPGKGTKVKIFLG